MIYTVTLNPALDVTVFIDTFQFNGVVRAERKISQAGGKGFNVSRALNILGSHNIAIGLLGGETGKRIMKKLNSESVENSIFWIEGETRTNTVIRDKNGKYLKVNESGPTVSGEEWTAFLEQIETIMKTGDIWVLSGSLPLGIPVGAYAVLCQHLKAKGCTVAMDTSGAAFRMGLNAVPDIVKPNQSEAWELIGHKCSNEEIINIFLAQSIPLVCLSLGGKGIILSSDQEAIRVEPPKINERNPVGAGDAALAGLIYSMDRKEPLKLMAKWTVASGTAAAKSENNCFSSIKEVKSLLLKLKVENETYR